MSILSRYILFQRKIGIDLVWKSGLFFKLLGKYIKKERKTIISNGVRFKMVGDISGLPDYVKKLATELEEVTKDLSKLRLNFAFDYGGRSEIVYSVNKFFSENNNRPITEEDISNGLLFKEDGDVDLLIRTGGDRRLSNFLLWELAYSELVYTDTKWPDFSREEFRKIFEKVSARERRYGSISGNSTLEESIVRSKESREKNLQMQY
ncbi:polyprenyl diphosphate synthase [Bacteriovoracaceae bacterium]|nr:polyprenyl diphosphate synthase [Bacteriovoracaceae bacterium]